jgi:hypothetical protein
MSDGLSTSAQGNAFRDSVKRLIELTPGSSNVQAECQIGTQAVDIYYEERTSFGNLRIACECKDYRRPLTRDLIARNIHPRYQPLLEKKLVDAVRIIAPLDLGAAAAAYVAEIGFRFHTLDQLESGIIDFRQYLHAQISGFEEGGLDRYYIKPALADGSSLEERIEQWISGPSSQPIAILAGYGMGKTSFAKWLAHALAKRALKDASNRIPILIPLSEISSEQTLEGLLGKLLAARHRIPGYHFSPFMELNQRGRFVVILDGFDEMKHTMSWAEFKHNFAELNRLHAANSRVLLLGRPSALLSEDEELFVLRGMRRTKNQTYLVPGAPEYVQLTLGEFSGDQAMEFIRRYATFRGATHSAMRGPDYRHVDIEARIQSIQTDPEMMGLVARPVQARMLADLAIDPEVKWRSFSRYELYREFIERITEREASKPSRSAFHHDARLSFIRRVAWWVWGRATASGFNLADLPDALLGPIPGGLSASPDGIRRDLVAGSILEKKAGDRYYFPHRSFLEFLVAEYLCIEATEIEDLQYFSQSMTQEVTDFIKDSGHARTVAAWRRSLDNIDAPLSFDLYMLIAWACNRVRSRHVPHIDAKMTARELMIEYSRLLDRNAPIDVIANYLSKVLASTSRARTRITCLVTLILVQASAAPELQLALRKQIAAFVLSNCLEQLRHWRDIEFELDSPQRLTRKDSYLWMLAGGFTAGTQETGKEFRIWVDFVKLYALAIDVLPPKYRVAELLQFFGAAPESFRLSELTGIHTALDADGVHFVERFFVHYPDPSVLLPFHDRLTVESWQNSTS